MRKTVFDHISDTEKRTENTMRSGVLLTNFEVFGNVVKNCLECFLIETKIRRKRRNKIAKKLLLIRSHIHGRDFLCLNWMNC